MVAHSIMFTLQHMGIHTFLQFVYVHREKNNTRTHILKDPVKYIYKIMYQWLDLHDIKHTVTERQNYIEYSQKSHHTVINVSQQKQPYCTVMCVPICGIFLNGIFSLLSKALGVEKNPDPVVIILGILELQIHQQQLLCYGLLTDKKILGFWKKKEVPTIKLWLSW